MSGALENGQFWWFCSSFYGSSLFPFILQTTNFQHPATNRVPLLAGFLNKKGIIISHSTSISASFPTSSNSPFFLEMVSNPTSNAQKAFTIERKQKQCLFSTDSFRNYKPIPQNPPTSHRCFSSSGQNKKNIR